MKNTNKKGFTIVELVIVIAVIAILAAVLIPTFSNLIKKANMSADQQAVANMNKLLAMEPKAQNVDEVVEILIANNYTNDLTTYYSNYTLGWIASENVIVLVENNQIAYPVGYVGKDFSFELIKPMATDADSLTEGLVDGKVIYVAEDVTVDGLSAPDAGTYSVNLNNNKVTSNGTVGSWVEGKFVLSNGIIESNNSNRDFAICAYAPSTVELNNVQVYAVPGKTPLMCQGGTLILNNVTATQSGVSPADYYNSAIQVVSKGGSAHTTVNSGIYSGKHAIYLDAPGYTIVINGGTFMGSTSVITADRDSNTYPDSAWSITINGGNFTGAINIANGVTCVVNGGTFSVDIGNTANVEIGAGKTVVDNGNGTWTVQ